VYFKRKEEMLHKMIMTENTLAPTIVRVVLGIVFFAHGSQKLLGWFGGGGFRETMGYFAGMMHIPIVFALLEIIAEFFGGLGLLLGLLTRLAAFGIAMNMIVAVLMVHGRFGFFANWERTQKGEGYVYHLLALAMCALLSIKGAGALSVDRKLARNAE
jgi:putative oxidoreductase